MIGAVLAGGAGRRMAAGGRGCVPKAALELGGRPLLSYPAAALGEVCERVVVLCKPGLSLPDLPGVERWEEPETPRHPLTGIVHALERAGEPVLVCAADMPFVTPDACRTLLMGAGSSHDAQAVLAVAAGRLTPTFGVYSPAGLDGLRAAAPDAPLSEIVEALVLVRVALPPPIVRSVNTPEELAEAEVAL